MATTGMRNWEGAVDAHLRKVGFELRPWVRALRSRSSLPPSLFCSCMQPQQAGERGSRDVNVNPAIASTPSFSVSPSRRLRCTLGTADCAEFVAAQICKPATTGLMCGVPRYHRGTPFGFHDLREQEERVGWHFESVMNELHSCFEKRQPSNGTKMLVPSAKSNQATMQVQILDAILAAAEMQSFANPKQQP